MTITYSDARIESITGPGAPMEDMVGRPITFATDDRGYRAMMLGHGQEVRDSLAVKLAADFPE